MGATRKITPEEYVLAVLSPKEKVEILFRMADEAFKLTALSPADIDAAIEKVRRKGYEAKRRGRSRSR